MPVNSGGGCGGVFRIDGAMAAVVRGRKAGVDVDVGNSGCMNGPVETAGCVVDTLGRAKLRRGLSRREARLSGRARMRTIPKKRRKERKRKGRLKRGERDMRARMAGDHGVGRRGCFGCVLCRER